ncbi:hypothetical protein AXG93_2891s1520 [Marchantia polymorpha subsp. ruderalis]|uniref:Uncharacterized protein n=1 Tax=Marchantia polymorpha subsp. ruderalis TaxID=1480154 RepID=A0A176WLT8_MARPO|nr:hypothetical protein AXG93_2891s1520 [Marchantia polymorpha subsp. ruderalis]
MGTQWAGALVQWSAGHRMNWIEAKSEGAGGSPLRHSESAAVPRAACLPACLPLDVPTLLLALYLAGLDIGYGGGGYSPHRSHQQQNSLGVRVLRLEIAPGELRNISHLTGANETNVDCGSRRRRSSAFPFDYGLACLRRWLLETDRISEILKQLRKSGERTSSCFDATGAAAQGKVASTRTRKAEGRKEGRKDAMTGLRGAEAEE